MQINHSYIKDRVGGATLPSCGHPRYCTDTSWRDGARVSNFNPKSCNLIQKCLFHCENIPVAHVHARTIFSLQTTKLHDIMQKTRESRRIQRSSGGRCSDQKGTFRNSFPFSQFKTKLRSSDWRDGRPGAQVLHTDCSGCF